MSRQHRCRAGVAIPMVIIFCGLMAGMVYMMTRTRVEQKQQNVMQFHALQAHFLAQGALQEALLKFRVLPTEAYMATALARGLCPFFVVRPGTPAPSEGPIKNPLALQTFTADIATIGPSDDPLIDKALVALQFKDQEFGSWYFKMNPKEVKALTSFTKSNEIVNVVSLEGVGGVSYYSRDALTGEWSIKMFEDKVHKTVEVIRSTS